MGRLALYVAITNHGFGHVTRTASVLAELQHRCPEVSLTIVTTAPRWLLEAYLSQDFTYRSQRLDIGVVQSDSLTFDKAATLQQLQTLRAIAPELIETEAHFIQEQNIPLILADIPPIATQIAKAAGVSCWMMSNFGWDLIYDQWGDEFKEMVGWVRRCFQDCDRLFRLPFHSPMSTFPVVEEIGLTGGRPKFSTAEIRDKLSLTAPQEHTVLLSFGGLGLNEVPYKNLQYFSDWQFITLNAQAPDLPNLIKVDGKHYRPVDLMPACGRLVSKPGYGTFAEACRVGIPIISIPRSDFAEAQYLLKGIEQHCTHQILAPAEFTTSNWEFLTRPLNEPLSSTRLSTDGNEAIAQAILDFLQAS